MKRFMTILAAVTLCLSLAGVAGANLVLNGDFETLSSPYDAHIVPDWTITLGNANNQAYGLVGYAHSPSHSFGFGDTPETDTLKQTFQTTSGLTYTFDFWLENTDVSQPLKNSFQAKWNDTTVLDLSGASAFDYTHYSFTETAGVGPTTITFLGADQFWYFLDDVGVTPVPIPPTALFLGSGLLGLVGLRRFRKS